MKPRPEQAARWVSSGTVLLLLLTLSLPAGAAEWKIVDPLTPVRTTNDLASLPGQKTLRLVGPRNGFASAQVVLMKEAGTSADIRVSRLQGTDPAVTIPVEVRYAVKMPPPTLTFEIYSAESDMNVTVPYHDALLPKSTPQETIVPIWLTARIPEAIPAGVYTGHIEVGSSRVPVRLEACVWTCPNPRQWVTHVGLLLSPETLARQYEVAMWSEEHWTLVARELELASALGDDDLWLSAFPRNHLGQERPWITFTRRGDTLTPNLAVVSRYLELWSQKLGAPHCVLMEMWNSGRYAENPDGTPPATEIFVDGKPEKAPLPGDEGSDKIWGPVLHELRGLVRKQGWSERIINIACADDLRPAKMVVDFFKKQAPDARWAVWTHGRGDPAPWKGQLTLGTMEVGHYEHMFCPWVGDVRADGITGGWDLSFPEYATARNFLVKYAPPSQYRSLPEGTVVNLRKVSSNMVRSGAGFTRLAFDFWPVAASDLPEAPAQPLLLAYEKSPWSIFYRNNSRALVEPGPDGPVATVRYEMLREGLQECEARIAIEKALESHAIKDPLESRCRDLLKGRLRTREQGGTFKGGHSGNSVGSSDRLWGVATNWQDSTALLFDLAGQVQLELNEKKP